MISSTYSIESVVRAYTKQSRIRFSAAPIGRSASPETSIDKVTLSKESQSLSNGFEKMVYRKEDFNLSRIKR